MHSIVALILMMAYVFGLLLPVAASWHVSGHARPPPRAPPPRCTMLGGAGYELLRNGLAAFAASAVATSLLHPLDTLKTRLQSDAYPVGASVDAPVTRQQLTSGLYKGLSANVLKEAPDAAVFLALSEELSRHLSVSSPWFASHLTVTLLLSGAIGDACGSVLRLPAEVVCKRLQTGSDCWQGALADTSWEAWMESWAAIVARDVPLGALQIAIYASGRQAIRAARSRAAAAAATATLAATTPSEGLNDAADAAGALPLMPLLPDGGLGTLGTLGSMVSADGAGAMLSVGGLDSAVVGGGQLDGLERLAEVLATALPDSLSDVLAGVLAGAVAAALTTPMDVIVTHVATTAHDGSGPPGRHPFQRGMDLIREQGSLTLSDPCQTAVIPL
jgi:hypothetical protein